MNDDDALAALTGDAPLAEPVSIATARNQSNRPKTRTQREPRKVGRPAKAQRAANWPITLFPDEAKWVSKQLDMCNDRLPGRMQLKCSDSLQAR